MEEQTKTDDLRSKAESGAPAPLPDYVLKFEKGNKRKRGHEEESVNEDDQDDELSDDPDPEDGEYEIQAGCIDITTDPNCFEIFW